MLADDVGESRRESTPSSFAAGRHSCLQREISNPLAAARSFNGSDRGQAACGQFIAGSPMLLRQGRCFIPDAGEDPGSYRCSAATIFSADAALQRGRRGPWFYAGLFQCGFAVAEMAVRSSKQCRRNQKVWSGQCIGCSGRLNSSIATCAALRLLPLSNSSRHLSVIICILSGDGSIWFASFLGQQLISRLSIRYSPSISLRFAAQATISLFR